MRPSDLNPDGTIAWRPVPPIASAIAEEYRLWCLAIAERERAARGVHA